MRALFKDREEAGRILAKELSDLSSENPLVLAIPRGGVVTGCEVAKVLHARLDIVVPRKLGAPGEPELALGAVMHDGSLFLNQDVVSLTGATDAYIEVEKRRQMEESVRRLRVYRGTRPYPDVKGRVIIVVDDGIATGATLIAALRWARLNDAKMVVAAAPVAPAETLSRLRAESDLVVCPRTPSPFYAIGQFYEEFDPVEDGEVTALLKGSWTD